jgi:hypothetical protein
MTSMVLNSLDLMSVGEVTLERKGAHSRRLLLDGRREVS